MKNVVVGHSAEDTGIMMKKDLINSILDVGLYNLYEVQVDILSAV